MPLKVKVLLEMLMVSLSLILIFNGHGILKGHAELEI